GAAMARADDKPPPAKPPVPSVVTLRLVDGKLQVEREMVVTVNRPVQETRTVMVNGKPTTVTVTVVVPETRVQKLLLSGDGFEIQDAAGQKVSPDRLAELLKTEAKALMSADGKPIDPSYLQGAKEGTLVVVPLKKEEPKKEPPPEKP